MPSRVVCGAVFTLVGALLLGLTVARRPETAPVVGAAPQVPAAAPSLQAPREPAPVAAVPRYERELAITRDVRIPRLAAILGDTRRERSVRQGAADDLIGIEERLPALGAREALITFAVQPGLDLDGVAIVAATTRALVRKSDESARASIQAILGGADARCSNAVRFALEQESDGEHGAFAKGLLVGLTAQGAKSHGPIEKH